MKTNIQLFTNVVIPIVNAAYSRGLIDKTAPWLPLATERSVEFLDFIDGDIPVAVAVRRWENGLSYVHWALWRTSLAIALEQPLFSPKWPGDVWGRACIDRRWDLQLDSLGEFHCRKARRSRIGAIAPVALDGRMSTRL